MGTGVSPAQVRPAWTLHRGPHVPAIPGTGDSDHLAANAAACAVRLSEEEPAVLEAVHQRVPPHEWREPAVRRAGVSSRP